MNVRRAFGSQLMMTVNESFGHKIYAKKCKNKILKCWAENERVGDDETKTKKKMEKKWDKAIEKERKNGHHMKANIYAITFTHPIETMHLEVGDLIKSILTKLQ